MDPPPVVATVKHALDGYLLTVLLADDAASDHQKSTTVHVLSHGNLHS